MDRMEAHRRHADAVRAAVTGGGASTDGALRAAVVARAAEAAGGAEGAPTTEPYDALARQIGEAAYLVTDAQVAAVRAAAGDDKGAFEIVMAACIGAGLTRWDAAARAIEEAGDAPA